jgi:serine protease Do
VPPPGRTAKPRLEGESLGSGFLVSQDGFIVTSGHVFAESDLAEIIVIVRLSDRREFEARLIGVDLESDIALLKIDAEGLPAAAIGSVEALEVGHWVAAIGSPFGLERSLTVGVVSGKSRTVEQELSVPFIQTDVPVNPGNSGGPLFNLRGEVVGVNALLFSDSGLYAGVAFATPIDLVMEVVGQLRASGRVVRGAIPIRVQDVTADLAQALRLPRPVGTLVSDLRPDSPATLRSGDVIVAFDGKPVHSSVDLLRQTARARPGSRVRLTLIREGRELSEWVPVLQREDPARTAPVEVPVRRRERLGLEVAAIDDEARRALGAEAGVRVTAAEALAARAGLQEDDVILSVTGEPVATVAALRGALARSSGMAVLRVQRGSVRAFVALRLPR